VKEGSGILWGWKEIADYLRIGEDKARLLADDPDFPLPVFRNGRGQVQSTKAALREWGYRRALALTGKAAGHDQEASA